MGAEACRRGERSKSGRRKNFEDWDQVKDGGAWKSAPDFEEEDECFCMVTC